MPFLLGGRLESEGRTAPARRSAKVAIEEEDEVEPASVSALDMTGWEMRRAPIVAEDVRNCLRFKDMESCVDGSEDVSLL